MMFVCGTTLEIPFIPTVIVATILARGARLEVRPGREATSEAGSRCLPIPAAGERRDHVPGQLHGPDFGGCSMTEVPKILLADHLKTPLPLWQISLSVIIVILTVHVGKSS